MDSIAHGVAKSRTRLSDFGIVHVAQMVKNLPAMQETRVQSLDQEDPLKKEMATTPVFLPGESQGRRSLVGCRLWGRTELDTTETT